MLKIACNHYLTPELTFKPLNKSETSVCWCAVDFSDHLGSQEQLAIKFKVIINAYFNLITFFQHNLLISFFCFADKTDSFSIFGKGERSTTDIV